MLARITGYVCNYFVVDLIVMLSKKKKIAVYLYDIKNRNVGLGEFAYQLGFYIANRASELRKDYGIQFIFIVPPGFESFFGDEVKYVVYSKGIRRLYLRLLLKVDLCHMIHQLTRLKYMRRADTNLMTIHDLNFLYEKKGSKIEKYRSKIKRQLDCCRRISYISYFVKSDVERVFSPEDEGEVIYNGVADLSSVKGDFSRFKLEKNGYLFHISSLMPKKNVHLLIEMMKFLPEEKLVVVGNLSTQYAKQLQSRITELGLTNVVMFDHVSNEDKAELYRNCKAFLFPSLCEGFGMPPIEVMHFGKPVFLSTLTSLPEIGGDCAYYYDDLEPEQMAKVTRVGLLDFERDKENKEQQIIERARSFNWETCSKKYIDLYLKILGLNRI